MTLCYFEVFTRIHAGYKQGALAGQGRSEIEVTIYEVKFGGH